MTPSPSQESGRSGAARYEVRALVGSGGSATVHEVFDSVRGTTLALKRLTPDAACKQITSLLFRREYRTLRELVHPAIVRVHDYGVDDAGPYYTMELAPGADARGLAPMPWRDAASLLRDVASALSLVHSRRLVHRDVSASNVRRMPDGTAKLLDFGSLCPMGVAPEVVGTPPFVPPEALDGRPLDARSDLFSLGALAYYVLTGSHAYPATRLGDLKRVWGQTVDAPSKLVTDVPEALDALVLSLLSLDPLARPVAASEVFDRLTAIAGLCGGESAGVALGYLTTPTLVGRDEVIARFRKRLRSADRGRGSTLVVEGRPGFGRSRLLGSLVTEAALANAVTACAQGAEGRSGPFGVVRALARRLAEADPMSSRESRPEAAVLPPALATDGAGVPSDPASFRARVDAAAAWFVDVSARSPLTLAIDDIDESDDASMSVIAKLAEAAPSRRLLLIATARATQGASAGRFRRLGGSYTLQPFRLTETRALVASIFGNVANLEMIASWIHDLSEGSPRVALELSQHLVDSGVARYENGAWVLPASLGELGLPSTVEQAIRKRMTGLGPKARLLAQGLALCVEAESVALEDYPVLIGATEPEEFFGALNELVAAQVLVGSGAAYAFVHEAMRAAVARSVAGAELSAVHLRLAEIAQAKSPRASIVAAHHLLQGGREGEAFATLLRFIDERDDYVVEGYRFLRSREGGALHERLLDWGLAQRAPVAQLVRIARQLFGLASFAFADAERFVPFVMPELERQTGLVYWDELAHIADDTQRVRACVARAHGRWANSPDDTRGLPSAVAIVEFASCTMHLAGVYSRTGQVERVVGLLPNITRLAPLSPAVAIAADVVRFSAAARRGWLASEIGVSLLARVRGQTAELKESIRVGLLLVTLFYQGLEHTMMDDVLAFQHADEIEAVAPYSALGCQLRVVAHLFQGREKQAEACRRKLDVALVGHGESERHVEAALAWESSACVALGDLVSVKRVLPALRERAAAYPGWLAQCMFVEGAHEALRGDLPKALSLMERAVELVTPGEHWIWLQVEGRIAALLLALGREKDARERAERALAVCSSRRMIPPYVDLLEATIALAEARLGERDAATARAAECVRRAEGRGATGILMLDLYRLQAEVALAAEDAATFARVSKSVVEMCSKVDSKAFAGRLSALLRMSVGAGFEPVEITSHPFRRGMTTTIARIRTELELCAGAAERASRSLGMVLQQSGVRRGYLYLNQTDGFVLAASRSDQAPPMEAEEWLLRWLHGFRGDSGDSETTSKGGTTFFDERFGLVALVTDEGDAPVVPGIVVIDCEGTEPRLVPDYVLREFANVLLDAGDAPRM